jgi:hypothetical protein
VKKFNRNPRSVRVDEDGYVVLSLGAWNYYARLFKTHGVDATAAMDTLDAFESAVALCNSSAKIYNLRPA